jgi:hypothetical protein
MREGRQLATFLAGALTLLSAVAHAGSAPKELYGKSIVVSWFESRQNGRHGALQNPTISSYVSTAGRTFTRVFVARGKGRWGFGHGGNLRTTSAEHGPGEGQAPGAKVSGTEFAGHSLSMTSVFESGARRISVEFDDRFTSCQAKVVYGKEAGHSTIRQTSMFGGQTVEVGAIDVSGVTCSVKEGNVFTEH